MEEKKFAELNNLYKSLKQLDLDILAKFNNIEITDEDYFLYGIQNDIISNTLNILVNYLTGNIESVGVNNSCRIILEALTIWTMNETGDISKVQKSIYRYCYAYVDLENFKSTTTKKQLQQEEFKIVNADRKKCACYIKKHFSCAYEDIEMQENGVDDPCFYLKKNLKDRVVFAKLINKYFPNNKQIGQLYEFLSIMIHPRCEMYPEAENAIKEKNQQLINDVIDLVINFLSKNNLLLIPKTCNDFNNDFFYNPLLKSNIHNIKEMERALNLSIINICYQNESYDWFSLFFLEKSKYLILDMMTSLSLGYTEHVIASFKPFIEMFSIFYHINTCKDLTEFEHLKRSYYISSRIQFNEHIKKYNIDIKQQNYKEELQELYKDYYATRYNVKFNKFYNNYLHNSLYFLDNSKKSFNKFVRKAFEATAFDELESREFMILYKISKDMSHASGYSFNATVDLVRVTSHKIMYTTLYIIHNFLLNVIDTLKKPNINFYLSNIIEYLKTHMQFQIDEIDKIHQKYN